MTIDAGKPTFDPAVCAVAWRDSKKNWHYCGLKKEHDIETHTCAMCSAMLGQMKMGQLPMDEHDISGNVVRHMEVTVHYPKRPIVKMVTVKIVEVSPSDLDAVQRRVHKVGCHCRYDGTVECQ